MATIQLDQDSVNPGGNLGVHVFGFPGSAFGYTADVLIWRNSGTFIIARTMQISGVFSGSGSGDYTIPSNWPAGQYTVNVSSSEHNTSVQASFTVADPSADDTATIVSVKITSTTGVEKTVFTPGEIIQTTATVRADGNNTSAVEVRTVLSIGSLQDATPSTLHTINPGATDTITNNMNVPTVGGDYSIQVMLQKRVNGVWGMESVSFKSFTVASNPMGDIDVTNSVIPSTGQTGQGVDIRLRTINKGSNGQFRYTATYNPDGAGNKVVEYNSFSLLNGENKLIFGSPILDKPVWTLK